MLALMKRLTNTVFGKIVVMIIVVGMAFFGVDTIVNQIQGGLGANIAQAGSRGFDATDLDRRVETVLRNMNQTSERPITKSEALENGMIDQIVAQESARVTILGYAASIGLAASTEAVLEETRSIEAFQNPLTGELDPTLLRQRLGQLGFSLQEFEEQIGDDLMIATLQAAATSAVQAPQAISDLQVLYFGEARNVSWFLFDALAGQPAINPTPEEVRAYYNANLEMLKQPERRALDLLRMSVEDFVGEVEVTDQEVATIYEATKAERFSEPDQRTYAELLFATRDAAREAFGLLAGGADPNSVRGALSVTLQTKRGAEVSNDALRDAMFGAGKQSGAMFGPREQNGQWLVARLISVQPGPVKPIEEVAETIRNDLARERAQIVFNQKVDRLEELLAAGYDLDRITQELKIPLLSFEPVDATGRTADGIPFEVLNQARDAVAQAFRLQQGELTSRFDAGNSIYVASTHSIVPASTPAFEELQADVRELLISERQVSAGLAAVNAMLDRVNAGEQTFEQAAAAASAPIETLPQSVTRATAEQSGIPGPIRSAMFSSRLGDVVNLPTGGPNMHVILKVTSVEPPSESMRAGLGAEVMSASANLIAQDLMQALQSEITAAIKLRNNEAPLAAYKRSISDQQ
ncbi:SurA N-terminal domain-containing protein [Hyphomonas sp.]|uniref:peptidylprolyl isomerase n=1 Tax=Hyphomonas sp. TaxID=87 RepID=UPI00391A017F